MRRPDARLVLLLVIVAACAALEGRSHDVAGDAPPDHALTRFLQGPDIPLESYRGIRKLSAANPRYRKSGWIRALVEFDARDGFRYDILDEGGSGYIRDRVLRKVLAGEAAAQNTPERNRTALSPDNYEFAAAPFGDGDSDESAIDDGLVRLSIVPRRREPLLVDGFIVLTAAEGDLVRVEGRLAKNPSFWTRRVDVVRRYGRVNGVRVPLETSSRAQVLVVGVSSLTMCYEYETVNGVVVAPRTSCS